MSDDRLDKVIECIDKCTTQKVKLHCNDCPYHNFPVETDCFDILMRDALELLKDYAGLQERHRILVEKADDMYLMLKEQPEIIRCRDCKHIGYTNSHWFCKMLSRCVDEDWFCADGELAEQNVTI